VTTALSRSFSEFFEAEKASAIVLIACTVLCLLVANSASGPAYHKFWQTYIAGMSIEHSRCRFSSPIWLS